MLVVGPPRVSYFFLNESFFQKVKVKGGRREKEERRARKRRGRVV